MLAKCMASLGAACVLKSIQLVIKVEHAAFLLVCCCGTAVYGHQAESCSLQGCNPGPSLVAAFPPKATCKASV
jgi:hypothetical protein